MSCQRPVGLLARGLVVGYVLWCSGCGPVTGVALLQNNPGLFQLVRRAAEPVQESLTRGGTTSTKKNSETAAVASETPSETTSESETP